jgi:hypothetical protein
LLSRVDVRLLDAGARKIAAIKGLRELSGLGLQEAKRLVDSAPVVVLRNLSVTEAEQARSRLEQAGANVMLESTASRPSDPLGQLRPLRARARSGCGSGLLSLLLTSGVAYRLWRYVR